jgi:hypothetical protein
MRRLLLLTTCLASVVLTVAVAVPSASAASGKLYVGKRPINPIDTGCANPGYNSVQAAVNVAHPDTTIVVCAGVYAEQVAIGTSNLNLVAQGSAVIRPSTAVANATDEDTGQPIVSIIDVKPGAHHVNLAGLTVDGSQVAASVNGCSDNLVGVLYQGKTHGVSGALTGVHVENTTPANSGCGAGQGIFVQAGSTGVGTASVSIAHASVSRYGKNGITCIDLGVTCTITRSTITTSPTSLVAQNGIQVGFGAVGAVAHNTIGGNDWTAYGTDTNPQVQSDFGAGILLYGAGINAAGVTTTSVSVNDNLLRNNQIGLEIVDSRVSASGNSITESGAGLPDSIGIYGVGCDAYCGYFNDNHGQSLTATASSGQIVKLSHNHVNFNSTPAGSYGIWLGDDNWSAQPGYYGPAGSEKALLSANTEAKVATLIEIGGGATT